MKPSRAQLRQLLRAVARTEPEEIDCGEFLAQVGHYLERLGPRAKAPPELQEVAQHLEVCPDCREEFEALLELHLDSGDPTSDA